MQAAGIGRYLPHYFEASTRYVDINTPLEPVNPEPPLLALPPLTAVQPDYPESTCCIKDVIGSREISWIIRGDDADVSSRAQRIFKFLDNLKETAPEPQPQREHCCSEHSVAFKRRGSGDGAWYLHQLPNGEWCKEK